MSATIADRILACLKGLATGDAIGKQTENLSREQLLQWYPGGVQGFEGQPGATIPRYLENSKRQWRIGETTDDTERTIAVARAILQDRGVQHATVGREMLKCEKCIHPGIRSLWEFHQAADPTRVTDQHDGCGAAIRVAPVGILYRPNRFDEIIAGAREASISTHGGPMALGAAAATAAAVSAALEEWSSQDIMEFAIAASAQAETRRSGSTTFADSMRHIYRELGRRSELLPEELAAEFFPSNPRTIVPLAIVIATLLESAQAAILLAANTGGDSDSVASIAGAILGARHPDTIDAQWYAVVERVNTHDFGSLANGLRDLRH